MASVCRTNFLSAIDWDLSFFDKDGKDAISPDGACIGTGAGDRTYSIPLTVDTGAEATSCNMNVNDLGSTKEYEMDFNFMLNQTQCYKYYFNSRKFMDFQKLKVPFSETEEIMVLGYSETNL